MMIRVFIALVLISLQSVYAKSAGFCELVTTDVSEQVRKPKSPNWSGMAEPSVQDLSMSERPLVLVAANYELESTNANVGVLVFDVKNGRTHPLNNSYFQIDSAKFNGTRALIVGVDGAGIWNSVGQQVKMFLNRKNQSPISTGALFADGETVLLGRQDGSVDLRNGSSRRSRKIFDRNPEIDVVSLSNSEEVAAVGTGSEIAIINTDTLEIFKNVSIARIQEHLGLSSSTTYGLYNGNLRFSTDRRFVIAEIGGRPLQGSRATGDWDSRLVSIPVNSSSAYEDLTTPAIHQGLTTLEGFLPFADEKEGTPMVAYIATGSKSRKIFVVRLGYKGPEVVAEYSSPLMNRREDFKRIGFNAMAASADGRFLATPSIQGIVGVIDRERNELIPIRFTHEVTTIEFMEFAKERGRNVLTIVDTNAKVYKVTVR